MTQGQPRLPGDKPWIFRTYAGHSTAEASNRLYRNNLAKGQTGLSVAFDLPTQTGLDPDHPLARGEVGKLGVSISHIGDMRELFEALPLGQMNTSMTINATAAWLLALYAAVADEQGAPRATLSGTIQNDIIKEYLSRGTYVFPPEPSLRLTRDTIVWCGREMPKWNPINVCSYHLQEAGATPVQEMAFALATAVTVLDAVRKSLPQAEFEQAVGRISFFVNAGLKLVTEIAKLRAFAELWDGICRERYGVADERLRRFRYGVQVNSLGLTEQQPENNIHRILIEMLAVVLSKSARARAVQLPAWNEALGLPRPWDQQWSLRMQQVVAYETDLLAHEDIFDGSTVMAGKVETLKREALVELACIEAMGGAVAGVESGYMKAELVASNTARIRAIESGEQTVVGVNAFTETEPSPLAAGADLAMATVSEHIEMDLVAKLDDWRKRRDGDAVRRALGKLEAAAREDRNIMEPSIACARAGVTTGEWGDTLRRVFGEYRAPTGIAAVSAIDGEELDGVRRAVAALSAKLGEPLKMLVGKPGLDGHSNGAEQIAVRARECGADVIYDGIRFTPADLVEAAAGARVHVVGLSILSGSHVSLVRDVMNGLKAHGLGHVPVVVGGIIPEEDGHVLRQLGVARIFTPKDYRLTVIMGDVVRLVDERLAQDGSDAA
ncbi:MAG TPA: protein meaA [Aestuariivirgaceae bacterium]|nr:protein meaA [Aestuariivirgaceae bacterium]